MKIAIVSDTHFGYSRFYEDSFKQGEEALLKASEYDLILHAGDLFDTRLPSFETLERVIRIFKNIKKKGKKVIAVHGNHEKRIRGYTNPVKLIASSGVLSYLHGSVEKFELNGEKISVLGVGYIPEEHSKTIIEEAVKRNKDKLEGFKILLIHQMLREFDPLAKSPLTTSFLEGLGFDLIVNGHIHKRKISKSLIIPGSTVVTSLGEDEIKEERGFVVYDTDLRKGEFVRINQRKIVAKTLEFHNASYEEVKESVEKAYKEAKESDGNCIVRIKLKGSLKEGLIPSLLSFKEKEDLFIKNEIKGNLIEELERAKEFFNYEDISKWSEEEVKRKTVERIKNKKLLNLIYEGELEDFEKLLEED